MNSQSGPETDSAGRPSRGDRFLPMVALGALGAIAIALWIGNGPRVFIDILSAAWAYCF